MKLKLDQISEELNERLHQLELISRDKERLQEDVRNLKRDNQVN